MPSSAQVWGGLAMFPPCPRAVKLHLTLCARVLEGLRPGPVAVALNLCDLLPPPGLPLERIKAEPDWRLMDDAWDEHPAVVDVKGMAESSTLPGDLRNRSDGTRDGQIHDSDWINLRGSHHLHASDKHMGTIPVGESIDEHHATHRWRICEFLEWLWIHRMIQFLMTLPPFPIGSCLWYRVVPEQRMLTDLSLEQSSQLAPRTDALSAAQPGDRMVALTIGDLRRAGSSDAQSREYLGLGEHDELDDDELVAPVCL